MPLPWYNYKKSLPTWVKECKLYRTEEFKRSSRLQIRPCYSRLQFFEYFAAELYILAKPYSAIPSMHFDSVNDLRSPAWCKIIYRPYSLNRYIPWDILMELSTSHVDNKILLHTLPLPPLACQKSAGTTRINNFDDDDDGKNNNYQHIIFSQPNV